MGIFTQGKGVLTMSREASKNRKNMLIKLVKNANKLIKEKIPDCFTNFGKPIIEGNQIDFEFSSEREPNAQFQAKQFIILIKDAKLTDVVDEIYIDLIQTVDSIIITEEDDFSFFEGND